MRDNRTLVFMVPSRGAHTGSCSVCAAKIEGGEVSVEEDDSDAEHCRRFVNAKAMRGEGFNSIDQASTSQDFLVRRIASTRHSRWRCAEAKPERTSSNSADPSASSASSRSNEAIPAVGASFKSARRFKTERNASSRWVLEAMTLPSPQSVQSPSIHDSIPCTFAPKDHAESKACAF